MTRCLPKKGNSKEVLLGFERTKNGLGTEMVRTRSIHCCEIQQIAKIVFFYNTTKCHNVETGRPPSLQSHPVRDASLGRTKCIRKNSIPSECYLFATSARVTDQCQRRTTELRTIITQPVRFHYAHLQLYHHRLLTNLFLIP